MLDDDAVDDPILAKLQKWDAAIRRSNGAWRLEAKMCFSMRDGHQWSEDERQAFEEQWRAPTVFNRIAPVLDAVSGAEIQNRQKVSYYAREIGDAQVNAVLTAAADWVRDECDAADEESEAFLDTLTCGIGWIETRFDSELDPEGRIQIERVDPLEIALDPAAKRRNGEDARYIRRQVELSKDDYEDLFPDGPAASSIMDDQQRESPGRHRRDVDAYSGDGEDDPLTSNDSVVINEYQWFERVTVYDALDPISGQQVELSAEKVAILAQMFGRHGMQFRAVPRQKRVYMRARIAGSQFVTPPEPLGFDRFTYVAITGKRDRNKQCWFGLVRAMVDPQKWINKFFSQILHIIDTNAKGGNLIEEGAVEDPREFEENYAAADRNVFVNPGAISGGKIMPKPQTPYPAGYERLMQFSSDIFPQVTGVNAEVLGLAARDQPGVLEAQRKQAAYGVLAAFFDSLRRYRKMQGRLLLKFLGLLSPQTLVRVVDQGLTQYVPMALAQASHQYDVIVDEAPAGPYQMERTLQTMLALMPMLKGAPIPPQMWAEIIRYVPLPESLKVKIAETLQQPPQPDPMAQQAQQLGMAKAQADIGKTQADAQKSQAGAVLDMARAQKEALNPYPPGAFA